VDSAKEVLSEARKVRREVATPFPSPRPGWRSLFWPMPLGAAAAVMLMAGSTSYLALVETPRLRRDLAEATAPQAVSSHFLSISRSEPEVVRVREGVRMVALAFSQSSPRRFPYYRCEVRDASGRTLLVSVVKAPPAREELQLLLPTAKLRPGAYVLLLAGLESVSAPAPAEAASYPFTVRYEEPGGND
jgi:hypothetical protein